jgi:hypothetical protein
MGYISAHTRKNGGVTEIRFGEKPKNLRMLRGSGDFVSKTDSYGNFDFQEPEIYGHFGRVF